MYFYQEKLENVDVVYFANLFVNREFGNDLIQQQISDLVETGLLQVATLHIVLSCPTNYPYQSIVQQILEKTILQVKFHINHENCHEFPGIMLVYQLALQTHSRSHFILYFHAKGITRFKGEREPVEKALHSIVISPWKKILKLFKNHPTIDKVGSTFSKQGWIWWNYWWARATYIAQLESPIKTTRRHYYEDWLCRVLIRPYTPLSEKRKEEDKDNAYVYNLSSDNCWGLSYPHQAEASQAIETVHNRRIHTEIDHNSLSLRR